MEFAHKPVMIDECIEALSINPQGFYLDGTAGGAGHCLAIAKQLTSGHLYAVDQDPDAIETIKKRLVGLPASVLQLNFRQAKEGLKAFGEPKLDGVLLDLGVSSYQLDKAQRGFSYNEDAPLDMRMSKAGETAAELIARIDRQELANILRLYGEEQYSWQIAGKIVLHRQAQPILTTKQLANIIISAVPPAVRRKSKNPARKSFQAIRIAINDELGALSDGLNNLFTLLKPGGRFVIITFHSLEDRIVKRQFNQWATACTCPPQLPRCVCENKAQAKLVGKKPRLANKQEQEENRRSRSAKLRVLEKN